MPLRSIGTLSPSFEKDAALLATIRWWWRKTSGHWCQPPLFHVRFDKNKTHLTKINMHSTRSVGAHGWEEVLRLDAMHNIFKFLSIPGEENSPGPWSIAQSYNIALNILGTIICCGEGLIVSAVSRG
jgi:hypothetical protein